MRLFIQRVLQAEVTVEGNTVGKIGKGLLVFVGAGKEDNREIADKYLKSFWDCVFLKMRQEKQIFP